MHQPINTALLSYGMSGEVFHAPLLQALPQFRLTHIVQRSRGKAREHFPDIHVVNSIDEIFDEPSVELIIVNTPNETHLDFASRALMAGKHVVVEKPFTVTVTEADKLIALAKEKGKVLTVFQNRRWDGDFLTVKKIIQEQRVGKIVEFEVHYDRFRNYVEANTWKESPRPGTGIVYNLGSHTLDQAVQLFGMPDYVDARIGIQRPGGMVDDYFDIRLTYKDLLVIVKSSYLVKEKMPRYIVHGVHGSFVKFGLDPQEEDLKNKKIPGGQDWGKENPEDWGKLNSVLPDHPYEGRIETERGDYLSFYKNLFATIREPGELAVKATEARDVIRLIELCYESNEKKQAIRV
ncbi:MAG TPA: oxidoreductase [Ohtaekwangia sp.]|nr:oxidoreductase [Ohtaekwangia sp.]